MVFMGLCILLAIGAIFYGFYDPPFFAFTSFFLAALWYWCAVRWVDKYGNWDSSSI